MCGSLRLEGIDKFYSWRGNSKIPVYNRGSISQIQWGGFAKEEKLSWWEEQGRGTRAVMPGLDAFTENKRVFHLPAGKSWGIAGLIVPIRGTDQVEFRALTRTPINVDTTKEIERSVPWHKGSLHTVAFQGEAETHPRWPIVIEINKKVQEAFQKFKEKE